MADAAFGINVDVDAIFEWRGFALIQVRLLDEVQFFFNTPWFVVRSGWL